MEVEEEVVDDVSARGRRGYGEVNLELTQVGLDGDGQVEGVGRTRADPERFVGHAFGEVVRQL